MREIDVLKSLDPIIAEFYGHGENNWFESFVYTNKQYSSFFQSYTRQTYKEIQKKKPTTCQQLTESTE